MSWSSTTARPHLPRNTEDKFPSLLKGGGGNPLDKAEDLLDDGLPDDAAELLRTLINENRAGLLTRQLCVRALIAGQRLDAALDAAKAAYELHPGLAPAALTLGEALLALQNLPVAIAEFQRAIRLDPKLEEAYVKLSQAWLEAGESAKALEALEPLKTHPAYSRLAQQAQAIGHQQRSDAGYIRHLFDQFSADYDTRMRGQLGYAAPEILRGLAELIGLHLTTHEILDLGCGTGLSGAAFADMAARLDGIDLSPAMVAKSRARAIYTDVRVADVETARPEHTGVYSLVIAADTLVYLGDLDPVFAMAANALQPGGTFLFTVEKAQEDFELGPKRRWRHSESYLRTAAARHGFTIAGLLDASPRTEAGTPVEGLAVALQKPA